MAIQQESVPTIDTYAVNGRPEQGSTSAIQSGWDAAEKLSSSSVDYDNEFKFSETLQIVKFLDPNGPFSVYKQHFLQEKAGRKAYICLGPTCPLCNKLRHKADDKRAFTVVNLSKDPVKRQMLIASARLFKTLHMVNSTPQGPITKNYWAMSRSGVKQTTTYHVVAVKPRDLMEDYGINPEAVDPIISGFTPYTKDAIREHSYAELLEIAEDLLANN